MFKLQEEEKITSITLLFGNFCCARAFQINTNQRNLLTLPKTPESEPTTGDRVAWQNEQKKKHKSKFKKGNKDVYPEADLVSPKYFVTALNELDICITGHIVGFNTIKVPEKENSKSKCYGDYDCPF